MAARLLEPAVTLHLRHAYFADGRCRDVEVRPTSACAQQLAHDGWRWRPSSDGGTLYAPRWEAGDTVPAPTTVWRFALYATDPVFAHYTAPPHAVDDAPTGRGATLLVYHVPVAPDDVAGAAWDVHAMVALPADLRATQPQPFAIVELHLPHAARMRAGGGAAPAVTYTFDARAVFWRYILVAASGDADALRGCQVLDDTDEAARVRFVEDAAPVALSGALAFRSTAPIALVERPLGRHRFTVQTAASGGRPTPLPYADAQHAWPQRDAAGAIVAWTAEVIAYV